MESVLRPKRSLWRRMVSAGLAIFGVSVVAQGVQWTANAWQTQDWIALGGCVAGALIVGAGVGSLATEWRRLWRLRQRAHERDEARDMLHSHAVGKAKAFCEKLAQQAGLDQSHPALQRWYAAIHETQSDREVVSLYAQLVQPVLDAQARREISRSAAESTLMIAVSPLALVDMAFIAWRNLRLINRIATLYGIELGITAVCDCFAWCCSISLSLAPANWCARWAWTGCRRIWRPGCRRAPRRALAPAC